MRNALQLKTHKTPEKNELMQQFRLKFLLTQNDSFVCKKKTPNLLIVSFAALSQKKNLFIVFIR